MDEFNESIRRKQQDLEIRRRTLKIMASKEEEDVLKSSIAIEEEDRISELPDHLLYSIVESLTLRDAFITSALSHRWRRICASRYLLRVDKINILPEEVGHPCIDCTKDKFVNAVNQILQFYDDDEDTRIFSFLICFCLGRKYTKHIDQWITLATKKCASYLCIRLNCAFSARDNCQECRDEWYVFRPELVFPGARFNLKHLLLSRCILGPSLFCKLCCLTILVLQDLNLGLSELLSICNCCWSLKKKFLLSCDLPPKLMFHGSLHRLRTLTISLCKGVKEIELSATNLLQFECDGPFLDNCSFLRVPKREEVRLFRFSVSQERLQYYIFQQLAKDLPNLRLLHVSMVNLERIPKSPAIFSKVEKLELFFYHEMEFDVLKMIAIIRSFPLLQKFYLVTRCSPDFEEGGKLELKEHIHEHLKEAHLGGFYGTPSQIQFAIYLLKHAPALKQMIIDPNAEFCSVHNEWLHSEGDRHRSSWYVGEQGMIREKLQEFSKDVVFII